MIPDPVVGAALPLVDGVLTELANAIAAAVKAVVGLLASWILVPSAPVCPATRPPGTGPAGGDWVTQCQQGASPAVTLRGYVLPVTILIAVVGLLWQAIVMVVTRKGEPLLQVVRGLWNSALWGAVGIAGTQLALNAGDDFANWVIVNALRTSSPGPPNQVFTAVFGAMLVAQLPQIPIVGILVGVVITLVVVIQIVLMIFRAAAVTILAGLLQLAAAGSFTRATSPWLAKVTGWLAALVAYKPMAALIYATGLVFMSDKQHAANFVIGIAVLALAVIALPAMMKFFNWTVGAVQSGSSIGMFGAGAAAGLHAASSLRGIGGNSASAHSRYLDEHGPGTSGSSPQPPTGAGNPTGPASPAGPAAPSGGSVPTVIDGWVVSAGPAKPGTPATATTPTVPGTPTAAAGGTATTSTGSAAGAASGATGPAAPVILGAVVAAQAATAAAKSAANTATDPAGGA